MNWHEPTEAEIDGLTDHRFVLDIYPEHIPHQAGTDGDALVRLARPGWVWWLRDIERKKGEGAGALGESGWADTREAALADAMEILAEWRS